MNFAVGAALWTLGNSNDWWIARRAGRHARVANRRQRLAPQARLIVEIVKHLLSGRFVCFDPIDKFVL